MAVALHIGANHGAIEDAERGEERRGAMPLVVMGHGPAPALLHRQARLGAVKRLNLALFVNRQHQRVVRRIEIKPNDIVHFLCKLRIVRELERAREMGL